MNALGGRQLKAREKGDALSRGRAAERHHATHTAGTGRGKPGHAKLDGLGNNRRGVRRRITVAMRTHLQGAAVKHRARWL